MNKDLLSYSILLLGSLFFLSMTLNMPVTSVTVINSALFPRLVLYGLIFLSGLGIYNTLRSKKKESVGKIRTPLYLCCASLLAFIILLPILGFIPATGIFIAAFSAYMEGSYRPKVLGGVAALGFGVAFGIDYIFTNVLSFILP